LLGESGGRLDGANADIAWERTSSRKRKTAAASVRLCVGGKFWRNKSCATLMASVITRSELMGKSTPRHTGLVLVGSGKAGRRWLRPVALRL
jgi:hypothetical protein